MQSCIARNGDGTMTIRILKSTDQFSPSVKVTGKKVDATWSVKKDKNEKSPRFAIATQFDFSACSNEEIISLAMKAVVIEVQRQWRDMANTKGSQVTTVNPFKTVNVKTAIIDATRRTASPMAKVSSLLNKLSPAERKALIASLAPAQAPKPEQKSA